MRHRTSPSDIVCALAQADTIVMDGFGGEVVAPSWLRRDVVFVNGESTPEEVAIAMIEHERESRRIWIAAAFLFAVGMFGAGIYCSWIWHG